MDKPIKHSYCVILDKVYAGENAGETEVPQWGVSSLERAISCSLRSLLLRRKSYIILKKNLIQSINIIIFAH